MPLGGRGGRGSPPVAPRLLLDHPAAAPVAPIPTSWRCVITAPDGTERGPEEVFAEIRTSPVAGRAEKSLVGAVTKDQIGDLVELAESDHDLSGVAQLLVGLRQAASDPMGASRALLAVLEAEPPAWEHKFVRKNMPGLQVCVVLAPGVPAVMPAGPEAFALLVAELLTTTGRHLDAAALLGNLQPTNAVVLALAAVHLASGHHELAVEVTERMPNVDDVSALCLVARGVALRVGGRFDDALSSLDQAMGDPDRHPGIIVAALGERADLLRLVGDDLAAQADIDRITALEGGTSIDELEASVQHGAYEPRETPPIPADDPLMIEAREWARRRLTGMGTPGTFAGRHHRSYEADVEAMLSAGQFGPAEHLLLGLIDAVEDEADESQVPIDPTYFKTLIDVLQREERLHEAQAIEERLEDAVERHGEVGTNGNGGANGNGAGNRTSIPEEHRARV